MRMLLVRNYSLNLQAAFLWVRVMKLLLFESAVLHNLCAFYYQKSYAMPVFCFPYCCEKVKFSETRRLLAFLMLLANNPHLEKPKDFSHSCCFLSWRADWSELWVTQELWKVALFRKSSFPGCPVICQPWPQLWGWWNPDGAKICLSCAEFPTVFCSCLCQWGLAGWGGRRRRRMLLLLWSSAPLASNSSQCSCTAPTISLVLYC